MKERRNEGRAKRKRLKLYNFHDLENKEIHLTSDTILIYM